MPPRLMPPRLNTRWRLSFLLPAFLAGQLLSPGRMHADPLDTFIRAQMQKQHVPGLAVGVIRNGKFIKEKGYGWADVERHVPVTTGTVFEIGSVTKQFTATSIMMLVDGGKISLDDKISRYLGGLPDAWDAVTIRQLLSHTSGIPDYEAIMGYGGYRNVMTPSQVIAIAASRPMDFAPGSRWNYSNTGYFLLTMLLERITQQSYIRYVRAHILSPLGMTHTRSSAPYEIIPQRAAGYEYRDGRLQNRDPIQPSATGGAGMLVSTLGDLAKWEAEILSPTLLRKQDYVLLRGNTLLADGSPSGYGFGWFVSPMHGHRAWEHSGGTPGFSSETLCLPDDHLVVLVLSNAYASDAPQNIMNHCAHLFVTALAYRPIPDPSPRVAAAFKDFLSHMTDPDVYAAPLTPAFAAELRPYWVRIRSAAGTRGPALSVVLVERLGSPIKPQYRYRVRFATGSRLYLVTLDSDGRFADYEGEEDD